MRRLCVQPASLDFRSANMKAAFELLFLQIVFLGRDSLGTCLAEINMEEKMETDVLIEC